MLPSWLMEQPSRLTLAPAVARHHQPVQLPASTYQQSAFKHLLCPAVPTHSGWFPVKIVVRRRLVTCKIEAPQCLRWAVAWAPAPVLLGLAPLLMPLAQLLLHQFRGMGFGKCLVLPGAQSLLAMAFLKAGVVL